MYERTMKKPSLRLNMRQQFAALLFSHSVSKMCMHHSESVRLVVNAKMRPLSWCSLVGWLISLLVCWLVDLLVSSFVDQLLLLN